MPPPIFGRNKIDSARMVRPIIDSANRIEYAACLTTSAYVSGSAKAAFPRSVSISRSRSYRRHHSPDARTLFPKLSMQQKRLLQKRPRRHDRINRGHQSSGYVGICLGNQRTNLDPLSGSFIARQPNSIRICDSTYPIFA